MDDRGDGVEESERVGAGDLGDRAGEAGGGQGAGGDDRRARRGEGVDPLAHDADVGMGLDAPRDFVGKAFAVDRERRAGRDLVDLGRGHDQRAQCAHFLVEQADGVGVGVVAAEAVRADHLGEPVAVVRRGRVAAVWQIGPRISLRRTLMPASASCHAASDPASPPPMM